VDTATSTANNQANQSWALDAIYTWKWN